MRALMSALYSLTSFSNLSHTPEECSFQFLRESISRLHRCRPGFVPLTSKVGQGIGHGGVARSHEAGVEGRAGQGLQHVEGPGTASFEGLPKAECQLRLSARRSVAARPLCLVIASSNTGTCVVYRICSRWVGVIIHVVSRECGREIHSSSYNHLCVRNAWKILLYNIVTFGCSIRVSACAPTSPSQPRGA